MSINAMTNAAIGRRMDFEPAEGVPKNLSEIAKAANTPPTPVPGSPAVAPPAGAKATEPSSAINTALQTLTTYIPTEVLTLYVAALAALDPLKDSQGHDIGRWLPFWIFLVGTPLTTWIAFATKVKSAGRLIPLKPVHWPIWEMSAATIAFGTWAFALPDTPFLEFKGQWYSPAVAGLAVMLVSYGLGALAPLLQRPLSS